MARPFITVQVRQNGRMLSPGHIKSCSVKEVTTTSWRFGYIDERQSIDDYDYTRPQIFVEELKEPHRYEITVEKCKSKFILDLFVNGSKVLEDLGKSVKGKITYNLPEPCKPPEPYKTREPTKGAKVLYVLPTTEVQGPSITVKRLIENLNNIQADIVAVSKGSLHETFVGLGCNVIYVPDKVNELINLSKNYDFVHIFNDMQSIRLAPQLNAKVIVSLHQDMALVPYMVEEIKKLQNYFYNFNTDSHHNTEFFKDITVIPSGVDTKLFKPSEERDKRGVIWVGRLVHEKGVLPVVEIAKKLPNYNFTMLAGEPDYLYQTVMGKQLPNLQLKIYNSDVDVASHLSKNSIFLLPSKHESLPISLLEAMSSGLCCVVTQVGDIPKIVQDGENGYLIPKDGDIVDWFCENITKFQVENVGRNARQTVLKYPLKHTLESFNSLYSSKPRISVIVATKNRRNRLEKCLNSILKEGYSDLEIIVVDGASTDNTVEFLKNYSEMHPEVKYITEIDNNQSEARNKGLRLASGKYIAFQDADDEMIPGKLSTLSLFLELNDKHFAVFGNTAFRMPDGRIYGNNRNAIPSEISFGTLNKTNFIGSGSIMLRNSPDLHFDEDKHFGEDYWLWMKLAMKYNIAYLDKDIYYWTTGSPDGISTHTKDWQEIDRYRKEEAGKVYSGSHYKDKMRIAIFCDAFGVHPFGGPAVYGYNVGEMLYKGQMFYIMFYNPFQTAYPHPDYCRRPEVLLSRTDNINVDDFNVFYVMSSPGAIEMLNAKGISPIIGSNHIPNSAPEHCLKYLNTQELAIREIMVASERSFLKNHRGKFWFAQSNFQRNEYIRLGMDLNNDKVFLAPNPTDTDLFSNPKHEFGDKIIWSGKHGWAKGMPFLTEVCKQLPDQGFSCLWGGEGPEMPILPNNVEVIKGNTLFGVPKHLKEGKIFLSTSVTENQPCAALEAMSCELPVVGFKTSGMPEVVKDGETGFLVELDDVNGMVDRIRQLINDESLRKEMGKKAREFVIENFSYYSTLDIYLKYFKMYLEV